MSRVVFTARAREDLLEIWLYVATHNSERWQIASMKASSSRAVRSRIILGLGARDRKSSQKRARS